VSSCCSQASLPVSARKDNFLRIALHQSQVYCIQVLWPLLAARGFWLGCKNQNPSGFKNMTRKGLRLFQGFGD
jgi:hypothetical protein